MNALKQADGLQVAVTGAAGFIGRAVVQRITRGALGRVAELRLNDVQPFEHSTAAVVTGSYADESVRRALLGEGVDVLFHLASLPGGAAERDPVLGRQVNLDGSLALLDGVAAKNKPVVVYASTIAVLGAPSGPVDDRTPLRPTGGYGTHKAMVELYLADLTRRGLIDGRTVRPAGIVARPRDAYAGFATAWMSDLFHAALDGRDIAVPVKSDAHAWLQSLDILADNLIHAARMSEIDLPRHRAWNLPATVVRIATLVEALERHTGTRLRVTYGDSPMDHPPLDLSAALSQGFLSDGDTDALVRRVLARIKGATGATGTVVNQ